MAPEAWRTCLLIKSSYDDMINAVNWLMVKSVGDTAFSYATNVFFNAADVIDELEILAGKYKAKDWAGVGIFLAKITSDLFVKSPIRDSFNYRNSQYITYRLQRLPPYTATKKSPVTPILSESPPESVANTNQNIIERLNECLGTIQDPFMKEEYIMQVE